MTAKSAAEPAGERRRLLRPMLLTFVPMASLALLSGVLSQPGRYDFRVARVQYEGGDWDEGPTTLPNLLREIRLRTSARPDPREYVVRLDSPQIYDYALLFLTGHEDIRLSRREIANLRDYLLAGGFLYADDDFGLDKALRREIRRLFPDRPLQEIPLAHPLYSIFYRFPRGLPKIHEHYEGAPRGYAILDGDRVMLYYTYNTNISDGWESPWVHGDPPAIREQALRMGVNIVLYSLSY